MQNPIFSTRLEPFPARYTSFSWREYALAAFIAVVLIFWPNRVRAQSNDSNVGPLSFIEFAQDEIARLSDLTSGLQERAEFVAVSDARLTRDFITGAKAESEARVVMRRLARAKSPADAFALESERAALNEWRTSFERAQLCIEDAEARLQTPVQQPVAQVSALR